MTPSVW